MTEQHQPAIGEAGIIDVLRPLARAVSGAYGLADDCAALSPLPGHDIVLKCDPVRAGVHFLAEDDPADIGWKALAVNVSDLAAKSARPVAYLLALSFPEAPARDWLLRFTAGLAEAQDAFGITLAGGDTDRAPGPLSITVTVLGEVPSGRMVRRATARPGDLLYVSGTLGDAAVGLRLHTAARDGTAGLAAGDRDALVARYLRPLPRLGLKAALRHHAGAAMDLSDGLLKDLGRMVAASVAETGSDVGAVVEAGRLPLSAAFRAASARGLARLEDAVAHGDDYEVLAAVPVAAASEFEASATAGGVPVTRIGGIVHGRGVRVHGPDGVDLQLDRIGYDHF